VISNNKCSRSYGQPKTFSETLIEGLYNINEQLQIKKSEASKEGYTCRVHHQSQRIDKCPNLVNFEMNLALILS